MNNVDHVDFVERFNLDDRLKRVLNRRRTPALIARTFCFLAQREKSY